MYQTWHLQLLHPNRNPNHLFELAFYTFLANKFKILYRILHKHLIDQNAPGWFLTFWFSVTYIKISSWKSWPINPWSKMLKIVGKVTYFVHFRFWSKRTMLKFKLILQRCMIFLRSPTSYQVCPDFFQIYRGRYLHWSIKIILPQYVLLRKHLQGQVLETNKYPL